MCGALGLARAWAAVTARAWDTVRPPMDTGAAEPQPGLAAESCWVSWTCVQSEDREQKGAKTRALQPPLNELGCQSHAPAPLVMATQTPGALDHRACEHLPGPSWSFLVLPGPEAAGAFLSPTASFPSPTSSFSKVLGAMVMKGMLAHAFSQACGKPRAPPT